MDGGGGGGALIQRIPWTRGSASRCIVNQYSEHVAHKYNDTVVVFDGYDSTNTKDMTHQGRSRGNAGTIVAFTGDTPVILKKDQFLANRQNKQRFIIMLSEEFTKKNCETHDATFRSVTTYLGRVSYRSKVSFNLLSFWFLEPWTIIYYIMFSVVYGLLIKLLWCQKRCLIIGVQKLLGNWNVLLIVLKYILKVLGVYLSTFPQKGMYLYLSTFVVESTCTCN